MRNAHSKTLKALANGFGIPIASIREHTRAAVTERDDELLRAITRLSPQSRQLLIRFLRTLPLPVAARTRRAKKGSR